MHERWITTVEWVLRVLAAASVCLGGLWAVSTNGLGWLHLGDLPRWVERGFAPWTYEWTQVPRSGVLPTDPDLRERIFEAYETVNGPTPTGETFGYAELGLGVSIQLYDPTWVQRLAYLALHVVAALAVAWICWTLAALVRSSRRTSPFTEANARRLTRVGVVLTAGSVLYSVAFLLVVRWMVETSSLGHQVAPPSYALSSIPWPSLVTGAAVLVLAQVWRRGVAMAEDLEGLV